MNQTFSLPRFGRLLRKYFTDNRGQLLANTGLLLVVLIAAAFVFYSDNPTGVNRNRSVPFFFIGWAAWYIFIWQQTEPLSHKERAITHLLQPASQVEKIVLVWLVSGVGFILVYLLIFGIVDTMGVQYVNSRDWPQGTPTLDPFYKLSSFIPPILWVFTALLHPVALTLLLLIRQYSLPVVAVLAFVLLFGGLIINSVFLERIMDLVGGTKTMPFDNLGVVSPLNPNQYRRISLPQPIGNQLRYAVGIIAIVLLYITAYFRLKEREV